MQLQCKACEKPIGGDEINIELGIAKCGSCHEVFSFLEEVGGAPRVKPLAELPKRFSIEHEGSDLVITWRWFTHSVWALLVFCVFWDGFLFAWYAAGSYMLTHQSGASLFILFMLIFPVLHVLVGVGLTYLLVCTFVNKTVIRASSNALTVHHGPLPAPGNLQLLSSDIKQIYCEAKRLRGEESLRVIYHVMAKKQDDSRVELVNGFEQLEQALFIEQQLEQHLQIRDQRVLEEVRY